ncbi:MAG: hypothetical protein QXL96_05940 [Ignisphaera sp.]
MGFNEVLPVFDTISRALSGTVSNISTILAWIGIILITVVIGYYLVIGILKAAKALLNMKVKYLGVLTLLLGLIFIAIAMVLP